MESRHSGGGEALRWGRRTRVGAGGGRLEGCNRWASTTCRSTCTTPARPWSSTPTCSGSPCAPTAPTSASAAHGSTSPASRCICSRSTCPRIAASTSPSASPTSTSRSHSIRARGVEVDDPKPVGTGTPVVPARPLGQPRRAQRASRRLTASRVSRRRRRTAAPASRAATSTRWTNVAASQPSTMR